MSAIFSNKYVACFFSYRYFVHVVSEIVYRNVHHSGGYIENNVLGGTRAKKKEKRRGSYSVLVV